MSDRISPIEFGEMLEAIRWIKKTLEEGDKRYAPFWVKYPVYFGTGAMLLWVLNQILATLTLVKLPN